MSQQQPDQAPCPDCNGKGFMQPPMQGDSVCAGGPVCDRCGGTGFVPNTADGE